MARIVIRGGRLVIRLSPWERLLAFHGDLHVPLARVRDVIAPATAHGKYVALDWRCCDCPAPPSPA